MIRPATITRRLLRFLIPAACLALLLAGCTVPWKSPVTASVTTPSGVPVTLPGEIRDGWVIVETTVNGRGPFRFILDTGANFSAISFAGAARAGIDPDATANITDISGDRREYPLGLAEIVEVGPVTLRRMPFIMTDNLAEMNARLDVVGLLGYPGFDGFTLDLDYPAGAVRLSDERIAPDQPGAVPLRRINHETPEVLVELLGPSGESREAHWFAVDSGGSAHFHLPESMRAWTHRDLGVGIGGGHGLSGVTRQNDIAPLRGPVRIGQTVIERAVAETDNHHTLIGHQLLRQFRVRLDPRSGLATFTPADPTQARVTALQYGGIGVKLSILHDNKLSLLGIAANSPAARAGLLPNDEVLAIDGVPVDDPAFVNRTGWMFHPPPQVTLTIRRELSDFEVIVPTEPLFPEDLDQIRNAGPDLEPPAVQLITQPDGTKELVFPD